jgi:hypothetical protein
VLSDFERHTLRNIQEQISAQDPELAEALANHAARSGPERRLRLGYDIVIGLALLSGIICLALAGTGAGPAGAGALLFATVTYAIRRRRFTLP